MGKKQPHDLKVSLEKVGPLIPVLLDAHGSIIDGHQRTEASEGWPTRVLEHVKTEEQRLLVEAHVHLARKSRKKGYTKALVNKIAQHYLDGGARILGGRRGNRLANEVSDLTVEAFRGVLQPHTVCLHLDKKFKQPKTKQTPSSEATVTSEKDEEPPARAHVYRGGGKGREVWAELHDYEAWLKRVGPMKALRNFLEDPVLERFGEGFWSLLDEEMREKIGAEMCASCEFKLSAAELGLDPLDVIVAKV